MSLKPAPGEPTLRERYEACFDDGKTVEQCAEYLDVTYQAAASTYWRIRKDREQWAE